MRVTGALNVRGAEVEVGASEDVDHLDLARHRPFAAPMSAAEHVDEPLRLRARGAGRHACRVEIGLLALAARVRGVDAELEIGRKREQLIVRLGVERLVEAPLERLERELAMAVVDDQAVDRLFANGVERAVLGSDGHCAFLFADGDEPRPADHAERIA